MVFEEIWDAVKKEEENQESLEQNVTIKLHLVLFHKIYCYDVLRDDVEDSLLVVSLRVNAIF